MCSVHVLVVQVVFAVSAFCLAYEYNNLSFRGLPFRQSLPKSLSTVKIARNDTGTEEIHGARGAFNQVRIVKSTKRRDKILQERKPDGSASITTHELPELWKANLNWFVDHLKSFVIRGNFDVDEFSSQRQTLQELYSQLILEVRSVKLTRQAQKKLEFVETLLVLMIDAEIEISNAAKSDFTRVYPMFYQLLELKIRALVLQEVSESPRINLKRFERELESLGSRFYQTRSTFKDHMGDLKRMLAGLTKTFNALRNRKNKQPKFDFDTPNS